MWRITIVAMVVLVLAPSLLAASAADADKAQEVFDSLYGANIQKVLAAHDTAGALDLASKMLEAARSAEGQPAFQTLLCVKAVELAGADPKGYETALAAAELLAEKVPEKAAAAKEIMLAIHQKQFEAAKGDERTIAGQVYVTDVMRAAEAAAQAGNYDEALRQSRQAQTVLASLRQPLPEALDALSKHAADLTKTLSRVTSFKGQLKTEATAKAARDELVRLLAVELDNPQEAAKYLDESSDPSLRKYVPALCRKVDEAPEAACLELGDWLRKEADAATTAGGKAGLLRRAAAYYERFLAVHPAADLDRTKAELALKKLQEDIGKLGDAATGGWTDLLRLVDLKRDAPSGVAKAADGFTFSPSAQTRLNLPVVVAGDYEIEVRFTRTVNKDGLSLVLPVADRYVVLMLGADRDQYWGLDQINGKNCTQNETTVKSGLLTGHPYTVAVRVSTTGDKTAIRATIDGKEFIKWAGPTVALTDSAFWRPSNPRIPAFGGWYSGLTLHSARLRMITGKAVPLEKYVEPGAAPAKTPTAPAKKSKGSV